MKSTAICGTRAKGNRNDRANENLLVAGDVEPLGAEATATELDELPLPYRFEVQGLFDTQHCPLLEHMDQVGGVINPSP